MDSCGRIEGDELKPGDLLQPRLLYCGSTVSIVRLYIDCECEAWDRNLDRYEAVVLVEEKQNQWGLDVLTVLSQDGTRWVYRVDMEVAT